MTKPEPKPKPERVVNLLLEGLPARERNKIVAGSDTVELVFGSILCEADESYRYVYFPLCGFISLVTIIGGSKPLEVGLIGYEGMLGATVVLGQKLAPLRGVVQGDGNALRIPVPQFRRMLRDSPALQRMLNRYLFVFMAQLTQTAGCNRYHEVRARLARWLLMTHDRAHADHFHLTHEFLADMVGVQRSAITIAAVALKKQKLIRYTRGEITILDRKGLEAASCECYEAALKDYQQLFA